MLGKSVALRAKYTKTVAYIFVREMRGKLAQAPYLPLIYFFYNLRVNSPKGIILPFCCV